MAQYRFVGGGAKASNFRHLLRTTASVLTFSLVKPVYTKLITRWTHAQSPHHPPSLGWGWPSRALNSTRLRRAGAVRSSSPGPLGFCGWLVCPSSRRLGGPASRRRWAAAPTAQPHTWMAKTLWPTLRLPASAARQIASALWLLWTPSPPRSLRPWLRRPSSLLVLRMARWVLAPAWGFRVSESDEDQASRSTLRATLRK